MKIKLLKVTSFGKKEAIEKEKEMKQLDMLQNGSM
jgi:hypothetical protein